MPPSTSNIMMCKPQSDLPGLFYWPCCASDLSFAFIAFWTCELASTQGWGPRKLLTCAESTTHSRAVVTKPHWLPILPLSLALFSLAICLQCISLMHVPNVTVCIPHKQSRERAVSSTRYTGNAQDASARFAA